MLCGILRSRVLRALCDLIEDVGPYWRERNLAAVELSECTNTKYVAMDIYTTLFTLVGRNIINSSMRKGDKWSCISRWTLCHTRTAILLSTVSHDEQSEILLTCASPSIAWRHWRHSRSQISHEPSDILLTYNTWVCMGLDVALRARNHSPWGLATLNSQSACHGSAKGRNLRPGVRAGSLACHGAESTRKDPRLEEKKCRCATKTHLYIVIQGSPSGCVRCQNSQLTFWNFLQNPGGDASWWKGTRR